MFDKIAKHIILIRFFLLVALAFLSFVGRAQHCVISYGTKTLYSPQQLTYSQPPKGYRPVFINHVGRHGARHLTKDPGASLAFTMLMKAESIDALSVHGVKLKKMILLLQSIEIPGLKSISQIGSSELYGIAERMSKNNRYIFDQPSLNISVAVTKEIRTSQSAAAFLKGFHNDSATSAIPKSTSDTSLRFYDLSPTYHEFENSGDWKKQIGLLESEQAKSNDVLSIFAVQFFKKSFKLTSEQKAEFCRDIYGFAAIIPSLRYEIAQAGIGVAELDFESLFTCKNLSALHFLDEAEDFLLKGPGSDTLGIQVKIAVPLLIDFIKTADEFCATTASALRLRFAHAETISPFASLTQVTPASIPVHDIRNFYKSWNAGRVIPLSANVQWIFYQRKQDTGYLVKFLLNEKEVRVKGLDTNLFPYYKWTDVRQFYMQLLKQMKVGLDDNMGIYLLNLQ